MDVQIRTDSISPRRCWSIRVAGQCRVIEVLCLGRSSLHNDDGRVVPLRALDRRRRLYRLVRGSEVIPLSPKIIDLLLYLVARQSALVPKDELFAALWPDVAVTDNALTQAVSELRPGARRRLLEAHLHSDRRPSRLPLRRAGARSRLEPTTGAGPPVVRTDDRGEAARDRRAGLRKRQQRSRVRLAVAGHRRDRHQRSARRRHAPHHRSRPRRRSAAAAGRPTWRYSVPDLHLDLGGGRELSTIGRPSSDHGARGGRRRPGKRWPRRKADGSTRAGLRAAGPHRRAVRARRFRSSQPMPAVHRTHRETSSLEAYQAFTEGRVRLESLDASLVPGAILDFERAVVLDPRYALAHVGLANARFWQDQMLRARNQPDAALLARAIDHVQRAIDLDRDLADAHATYAFLLVSAGRFSEGSVSGTARRGTRTRLLGEPVPARACRVGRRPAAGARARDGVERRTFLSRISKRQWCTLREVRSIAPSRCCARGRSSRTARRICGSGIQPRDCTGSSAWCVWRKSDVNEACAEFEREIAVGPTQLYAAEFAMNVYDGLGFAALVKNPAEAVRMFRRALELFPDHARSLVGLGAALAGTGDKRAADAAFTHAATAIDGVTSRRSVRVRRHSPKRSCMRCAAVATRRSVSLKRLVDRPELPFTGWTLPIEPLVASLRQRADFQGVLATLARHAR